MAKPLQPLITVWKNGAGTVKYRAYLSNASDHRHVVMALEGRLYRLADLEQARDADELVNGHTVTVVKSHVREHGAKRYSFTVTVTLLLDPTLAG